VRYVLDANIAIAALNDVPGVREHLAAVPGSEVGVRRGQLVPSWRKVLVGYEA